MVLSTAGLIAAYVLLGILLLSLNLRADWPWPVKAGGIVLTSGFYIVSYLSIPPLLGWPIERTPPAHFRLVGAHVEQPNKRLRTEGSIYLWLTPLIEQQPPPPPRAYQLPYNELIHERVLLAKQRMERGMPQIGELRDDMDLSAMRVEDADRLGLESVPIEFYDLPNPLFPEDK